MSSRPPVREDDEDPLLRSVREFRAAFDSVHWIRATPIAEVAYLRVLVGKYPEPARLFLDEVARAAAEHPGGASSGSGG